MPTSPPTPLCTSTAAFGRAQCETKIFESFARTTARGVRDVCVGTALSLSRSLDGAAGDAEAPRVSSPRTDLLAYPSRPRTACRSRDGSRARRALQLAASLRLHASVAPTPIRRNIAKYARQHSWSLTTRPLDRRASARPAPVAQELTRLQLDANSTGTRHDHALYAM